MEQDQKLISLVIQNGPCQWEKIARSVDHRNGKQCRERWSNQLNPLIKKGKWSIEENLLILLK